MWHRFTFCVAKSTDRRRSPSLHRRSAAAGRLPRTSLPVRLIKAAFQPVATAPSVSQVWQEQMKRMEAAAAMVRRSRALMGGSATPITWDFIGPLPMLNGLRPGYIRSAGGPSEACWQTPHSPGCSDKTASK